MLKKPHKLRVIVLGGSFCVVAGIVIARLVNLQVTQHDHYVDRAERQQTIRLTIQPERGDILDCKDRPLAASAGTLSIYIDPKYFHEPEADVDLSSLSSQVAYYCALSPAAARGRFERKGVTDLGRKLNPEVAQKVGNLLEEHGISKRGFWFHRETKRQYPRALAPHVIGFCGTDQDGDNEGLAGLEYFYTDKLSGKRVETTASRTGISQVMQPVATKDIMDARGNTLVLTIDSAIQEAAEQSLARAGTKHDADAAGVVVQDVNTGAILAMASWPTYDNNNYKKGTDSSRRNRLLTDPLETGSVAKLFTASFLLDSGKISLDTLVDCEGGRAMIGRRRVTDSPGHVLNVVPFIEVIRYSSNVGTIKAAQALENDEWYNYLRSFGIGQKTGIDLPGEGTGILYPVSKWTALSRSSLPMGYEMSLTPIQIVNAVSGISNGGELLQPYVVKEMRDSRGNVVWQHERTVRNRMIRPATSILMRQVMEDVVAHGTGARAGVNGFRVGGKTGTTRKSQVLDRREYIASFAGVLPIDDPKIAIYCYVDNPKSGAYYAADVAAPIFQEVATESVLQLGLIPTEPLATAETAVAAASTPSAAATLAAALAADAGTIENPMPDLAGLSMGEVRERLAGQSQNVRFVGSGRVADQNPVPGEAIEPETGIIVYFTPEAPQNGAPAVDKDAKRVASAGRTTP